MLPKINQEAERVDEDLSQDIEKLKHILKKEYQCGQNFRTIVELMPVPVLVADNIHDVIVYANPAFCETFGYVSEDLLDKSCNVLVPADLIPERMRLKKQHTEEQFNAQMGNVRKHEINFLHGSGKIMNIPAIVYNWKSNGDRYVTMIFLDRRDDDTLFFNG